MHPCIWCFFSEPVYYAANDSKYSFCERHRQMTTKQPSCSLRVSCGRLLLCDLSVLRELQENGSIERRIYGTKQLPGRFIVVPRYLFKFMALRCQDDSDSGSPSPPPASTGGRKRLLSDSNEFADESSGSSANPNREVLCFRNSLQRSQFLSLVRELGPEACAGVQSYDDMNTDELFIVCKPRVRHRDFNHLACTTLSSEANTMYDIYKHSGVELDMGDAKAPSAAAAYELKPRPRVVPASPAASPDMPLNDRLKGGSLRPALLAAVSAELEPTLRAAKQPRREEHVPVNHAQLQQQHQQHEVFYRFEQQPVYHDARLLLQQQQQQQRHYEAAFALPSMATGLAQPMPPMQRSTAPNVQFLTPLQDILRDILRSNDVSSSAKLAPIQPLAKLACDHEAPLY